VTMEKTAGKQGLSTVEPEIKKQDVYNVMM
jgi:hypothetical protein